MTVRELYDELARLMREDPDVEDYTVVDADGEIIESARTDEAYQELNLEF